MLVASVAVVCLLVVRHPVVMSLKKLVCLSHCCGIVTIQVGSIVVVVVLSVAMEVAHIFHLVVVDRVEVVVVNQVAVALKKVVVAPLRCLVPMVVDLGVVAMKKVLHV